MDFRTWQSYTLNAKHSRYKSIKRGDGNMLIAETECRIEQRAVTWLWTSLAVDRLVSTGKLSTKQSNTYY